MRARRRRSWVLALAAAAAVSLGFGPCAGGGVGTSLFRFEAPRFRQLSLAGPIAFALRLPAFAPTAAVKLTVDGRPVTPANPTRSRVELRGELDGLAVGVHHLRAELDLELPFGSLPLVASTRFELVHLDHPDECEVLNNAECLFPYPSSRFLMRAATPTGWRVDFPAVGMPRFRGTPSGPMPVSPTPYSVLDGFSPTVQILMDFPGGVDLVASNAPRLHADTRTFGTRSLDPDSPTVLLDADTGQRVAHFVENDARAVGAYAARQATILRPAESLIPGHHYIVAVRHLVHPDGSPVTAEPAFAALRDRRPTDIAALAARRPHFERLFRILERAGIARHDLILAFDFVVQSDQGLTSQMLAMRDDAFAWIDQQDPRSLFEVDSVTEVTPAAACASSDSAVWRIVRGHFRAPLYLTSDPNADPPNLGFLNVDADGRPVATGVTEAPFGIAIPCAVLADGGSPAPPLVVGHGLFGNGPDTVAELSQAVGSLMASLHARGLLDSRIRYDYVSGGTNWDGLSQADVSVPNLYGSFVFKIFADFDNFPALPDRLRQGQLDTLVLARLMKRGIFNLDPAFQVNGPDGPVGVIDPQHEYYFGASLGGIMGIMFAALSPDVERVNVDVPAINFSLLLQRAKPFKEFQQLLNAINPDPMEQLLGLGVIHELWVRGESAGYATHVTRDPLPGTNAKRVLMTVALYDQQVSNLGSQIAGATLGLSNLRGSDMPNLTGMPDKAGPLDSGYVVYDTDAYDPNNPADQQFIPPLANLPAPTDDNRCDPHTRRGFIPASLEQLIGFFQPGGVIENFCSDDGLCNASDPFERPYGEETPCNPLGG